MRTRVTGSPWPDSSSATVPASPRAIAAREVVEPEPPRRVGGDQRREVRARERDPPHLLEHDDRVDQTEPEAAVPLVDEHTGPAEVDERCQSPTRRARRRASDRADQSAMNARTASRSASCSAENVKSMAGRAYGGGRSRLTTSWTSR